MFEHPVSFRAYFPMQFIADKVYGPVEAYSVAEAKQLLAAHIGAHVPLSRNLQRMINGSWVWENCDGPTGA